MSISEGHLKYKRHIKQEDDNYKLVSHWTSAETVEFENGLTLADSKVELTQAQYDALGDEKYTNGVDYYITDAEAAGVVGVDITQEQYEALSEEEKNNGTIYFVEDGTDVIGANNISYDNKTSGMEANTVQKAIDEVSADISATNESVTKLNSDLTSQEWETLPVTNTDNYTCTVRKHKSLPLLYVSVKETSSSVDKTANVGSNNLLGTLDDTTISTSSSMCAIIAIAYNNTFCGMGSISISKGKINLIAWNNPGTFTRMRAYGMFCIIG